MERVSEGTSSRRQAAHGALGSKRTADSRALALVSTIRELRAAGFISHWALADELNQRGIPTARGGSWHYTTVVRMLTRLGLITLRKGRINNALAHKQAADARAKALAPTIRALQGKSLVSLKSIAHELVPPRRVTLSRRYDRGAYIDARTIFLPVESICPRLVGG
jgi:hypothetical protein